MSSNSTGNSSRKHWFVGISVALLGVAVARIICPGIEENGVRFAAMIFGHFLSLGGLFIIAHGVFKRHQAED